MLSEREADEMKEQPKCGEGQIHRFSHPKKGTRQVALTIQDESRSTRWPRLLKYETGRWNSDGKNRAQMAIFNT